MLKNTNGVSEASKYQMRQNKPFTVIPYKKYEEPKQYLHCKFHIGRRLLFNGFCPECGPTLPATRKVFRFMKQPSEPQASGVR
jgi:hypothetical protein